MPAVCSEGAGAALPRSPLLRSCSVIKYIGSKRVLVPTIVSIVRALPGVHSVLDLFSGTSRVGHALKGHGYRVTANDHNAYAYRLAQCYVQADSERHGTAAGKLIKELNGLPGAAGYFTRTFCEQSRFFQPHNGERVDAIRDRIAELALDPVLESVLLVSLMEAADRVDSTCGLQMAYLKKWAPRAFNDMELRVPQLHPGPGTAWQMEAVQAAGREAFDLVYLDPPYNQHKYLGNYHVWETLVRWDAPEVYGTACKRVDCRTRRSDFNSKKRIREAMQQVLDGVRSRFTLVSFSNEGYLAYEELMEMLQPRGEVVSLTVDYKRYVGAQIGIYNPSGDKVGKVSHLRNREYLFAVGDGVEHALRTAGIDADAAQ